jgi:SlyX protein
MDKPETHASDDRIRAMEERLTFQQKTIDDLHEIVLRHERQFEALSRDMSRLAATLGRLSELAAGGDLPHEKPPHY